MATPKLDIYLVIGLTKESRHWSNEFLDALKTKFTPHSIQLVDLPGSGKFIDGVSPLAIEKIVDQARTQLTFHPDHQRMVIAISLGGMVAWDWVTRYPDDFTQMVMINSSLGSLSPVWKRVQPEAMVNFFKIGFSRNSHKKEKYILDLCSNNGVKADLIYPVWVKLANESGMSFSNTLRQVIAGMKFKPKKSPDIPLLVVAAKHDRLAHFSCSEAIARHSGAKLVLCDDPKIGHAFHIDGVDFLTDTIQNWIS